jgi:DNA gyrase subunit A
MNITEKTGKLIAIKGVLDTDDLMIINKSGITLRMAVLKLRVLGRATQGVRLINLREGDAIASITYVDASEKDNTEEVELLEITEVEEMTDIDDDASTIDEVEEEEAGDDEQADNGKEFDDSADEEKENL